MKPGPSSVPWGTSADVKHTAVGDELAMLGAGANHNSRKQSRDQNSQVIRPNLFSSECSRAVCYIFFSLSHL